MNPDIKSLNQLFHTIGARDGIDNFGLSLNGTAGLELRSGTRIYFEYSQEQGLLSIYTPICPFPTDKAKLLLLFESMLRLNFLLGEIEGELAVSDYFSEAVLQRRMKGKELDANHIDAAIDRLIKDRATVIALLEEKGGIEKSGSRDNRSSKTYMQRIMQSR